MNYPDQPCHDRAMFDPKHCNVSLTDELNDCSAAESCFILIPHHCIFAPDVYCILLFASPFEWIATPPMARYSGCANPFDCFFYFIHILLSSGGWVKMKLKLPHFHVSDTSRCQLNPTPPLQMRDFDWSHFWAQPLHISLTEEGAPQPWEQSTTALQLRIYCTVPNIFGPICVLQYFSLDT